MRIGFAQAGHTQLCLPWVLDLGLALCTDGWISSATWASVWRRFLGGDEAEGEVCTCGLERGRLEGEGWISSATWETVWRRFLGGDEAEGEVCAYGLERGRLVGEERGVGRVSGVRMGMLVLRDLKRRVGCEWGGERLGCVLGVGWDEGRRGKSPSVKRGVEVGGLEREEERVLGGEVGERLDVRGVEKRDEVESVEEREEEGEEGEEGGVGDIEGFEGDEGLEGDGGLEGECFWGEGLEGVL